MTNEKTNYELIKSLELQVIELKNRIKKEKEKKDPDTWTIVNRKSRYRTSNRTRPRHISHKFYIHSKNENRNVMQIYGDYAVGSKNCIYICKFPRMLSLINEIADDNNARTAKHFQSKAQAILTEIQSEVDKIKPEARHYYEI